MNSIIDKIKKLLALAEDQRGRPEGELAASKALELMARHAIEERDLGVRAKITESRIPVPASQWQYSLWAVLAEHCQVACYRSPGLIILFGAESDIEVCRYLFDICKRQVDRQTASYILNNLASGKSEANSFRRSAVAGLNAKLKAQRAGLNQETGLVLASRAAQGQRAAEEKYKVTAARVPTVEFNPAGWRAGYEMEVNAAVGGG